MGNGEAVSHLLRLARKGKVTLLYSARNTEHNEAAALRDYLLQRFCFINRSIFLYKLHPQPPNAVTGTYDTAGFLLSFMNKQKKMERR